MWGGKRVLIFFATSDKKKKHFIYHDMWGGKRVLIFFTTREKKKNYIIYLDMWESSTYNI